MLETGNLFQNVPVGESSEVFEPLLARPGIRVERTHFAWACFAGRLFGINRLRRNGWWF